MPIFRDIILVGLLLTGYYLGGCSKTDEQVLRQTFDVPKTTKLMVLNSAPPESSWVREGLKIDATFDLTAKEFGTYLTRVQQDQNWQSFPLSREFLIKITGIKRALKARQRVYQERGEELPKPGSIYNPTEAQLLQRWRNQLPLDVANGFYSCLTAGNNILYEDKIPCSQRSGDLNDFMLAILDTDRMQLRIKVHTAY